MLKQLPLILTEGRITQLCHPWVLQKSAHLWPEIIFLNQNKMSSPCRAITVNVRERYVGTRQWRKTSDKAFRQQHRPCCHKTAVHLAQHRTRQSQTTRLFLHGNKCLRKRRQSCWLPNNAVSHYVVSN